MAITYALSIKKLEVVPQLEGQQNVVIKVLWGYSGDDGNGHKAMIPGGTDIILQQGGNFTPYNELTVDQVTGWVLNTWTPGETITYKAMVDKQLQTQTPPWEINN